MKSKILIILSTLFVIAGCANNNKPNNNMNFSYHLKNTINKQLTNSINEINSNTRHNFIFNDEYNKSIGKTANYSLQQQNHNQIYNINAQPKYNNPTITYVNNNTNPNKTITINWNGTISNLAKNLASAIHYKLNVAGNAPISPIIVNISSNNISIPDVISLINTQINPYNAQFNINTKIEKITLTYNLSNQIYKVKTLSELINAVAFTKNHSNSGRPYTNSIDHAAFKYGRNGGIAYEYNKINDIINSRDAELNNTYNINYITKYKKSKNVWYLPASIVYNNNKYTTIAPQRIINPELSLWRSYLIKSYHPPILEDKFLPQGSKEFYRWEKLVKRGWLAGIKEAQEIFTISLNKLNRYFKGMILYSKLHPYWFKNNQNLLNSSNKIIVHNFNNVNLPETVPTIHLFNSTNPDKGVTYY